VPQRRGRKCFPPRLIVRRGANEEIHLAESGNVALIVKIISIDRFFLRWASLSPPMAPMIFSTESSAERRHYFFTVCTGEYGIRCAHAIHTIDMFHLCRWHIRAPLCAPYFSRASCTARDYPPLCVYIEIFPAYCTCTCAYMYIYVCICVCVISGKVSHGNAALQRSNFSAPLTFFPGPEFPRFGFHCICGTRNLPPGLNYASSRYLCDTISIDSNLP